MREETLVRQPPAAQRVLMGMVVALMGDTAAEDLLQDLAILMTRKRETIDEDCRSSPMPAASPSTS